MHMRGWQAKKWLSKKAKRGFSDYPLATLAFYGPDDRRASKVAVGVFHRPQDEPPEPRRWFSQTGDVRADETILIEIATFLRENGVRSVAMSDRIIGCPHEEGIDYPEGQNCPSCPYWAGRNRFTGEIEET
jgi:hypothetical protein